MGPSANWPAPAPPPQVPRRLAGRFEPPFGPAGKPLSELASIQSRHIGSPVEGLSLLTTWAEGALPDAPRARLRLALLGCLPPARPAISPAAPTGAPTPSTYPAASPGPSPRAATRHPRPPRPGPGGLRTACSVWLRGHRCAGVSYREGHPARAPTVRSTAAPDSSPNATQPLWRALNPSGPDRPARIASTQTHRPHLGCKNANRSTSG
ncbi:hypothetical protein N7447_011244 [Penicillium robsamsonii]|uniref:uncharacterized protein n=1 Tax=Penicillium robsamsonii TaxID=1792511 RepID=UPI002548F603|nr:uncharacterized protein N7447_011244 [Penicillium robsamsonii]KAJ5807232.1 hypothetical protein N7447_011244 [Penicillium robsamsonii]